MPCEALRGVVREDQVTDAELDDLLNPATFQGDAAGIVERILARYDA
ncbi:hypothetical protein GCM10027449_09990 [Sinomonas notoginsengisoli]